MTQHHDGRGERGADPASPLTRYLRPADRRLRVRDGLELAAGTAWPVAAVGGLILAAGRVFPLPHYRLWSLLPLLLWLLAVPAWTLARRHSLLATARRVDRELGLKDRLATALELSEGPDRAWDADLCARQAADALAVAARLEPRRDLPVRWPRRKLAVAGGVLVAALALTLIPNPMDLVLLQRAEVAQAARAEASRLEELARAAEQARGLDPAEREALTRELRDLAERLRSNRGDREQALRDVAELQALLRERLDPQAVARQAGLEALAAQMAALAGAPDRGNTPQDAAQQLLALAGQLDQQTAAEREALAQTLDEAAERLGAGDAALAQALRDVGAAARRGDTRGAQTAAGAANDALAAAAADMALQDALAATLRQVQSGEQRIAQAGTAGAAGQAPAGSGTGNSGAQGGQGGQGAGNQVGSGGGSQADRLPPANRSGRAGEPVGPGKAYGTDATVYAPQGQQASAAAGGPAEFLPGQQGSEGETQVRPGQAAQPGAQDTSVVPYEAVFPEYSRAAAEAIEREYVPPGLREYVKEYFGQLEP